MRILKVTCIDQVGIISKISTVLFKNNINIIRLNEYVEPIHNSFFFRAEIEGDSSSLKLKGELDSVLGPKTIIEISELQKKKVVIMATSQSHCLGDLLLREKSNSLNIEIDSTSRPSSKTSSISLLLFS